MAEQRDVIEILTHDHREVEEMFASYQQATDPQERKKLMDKATIELVRHSVAEEEYLYPAAREELSNGEELIRQELEQHAEAEKTMDALDKMSPDNIEFSSTAQQLMEQIRMHVAEEEGALFPELRAKMSPDQLKDLGSKIEKAKKLAPTRPHPAAPDTPPGNKLAAPGAGIVDRLRDMLTGRGR